MPKPISVQLYSVRQDAANDFPATLERIASMGYVGVEFAGLHGMPAADVAAVLKRVGLQASSAHVSIPTGENIDDIAHDAEILGYSLIVSGVGADALKTRDDALRAAEKLEQGAVLAARKGLRFGYHNHWWEFEIRYGHESAYEVLLNEAPHLFSQLDVYWCAMGGCDAAETLAKWASRIPLLHIKDGPLVRGQAHTAVGRGKLEMAPIVAAADDEVLEWLIVELDACDTDMNEAVAESCRYLVDAGLAAGRKV